MAVTCYCTGNNWIGDAMNGLLSPTVRNLLGGEADTEVLCHHSKGAQEAGETACQEPHEVKKGEMQNSASGEE